MTLAHVGAVTTAFYRCALALPVLAVLAVLEQRRLGQRPLTSRLYAVAGRPVPRHRPGAVESRDRRCRRRRGDRARQPAGAVRGRVRLAGPAGAARTAVTWRAAGRTGGSRPGVRHARRSRGRPGSGGGRRLRPRHLGGLRLLPADPAHDRGHTPHVAGQLADATAGAAIGSVVIGLLFGGLSFGVSWPSLGWLLLLAMLSQTAGWLLITSSLPRLPAAMSSLLLLLQPAAALVLADVVLQRAADVVQIGGAVAGLPGRARGRQDRGAARAARTSPARHPPWRLRRCDGEQHVAVAQAGRGRIDGGASRRRPRAGNSMCKTADRSARLAKSQLGAALHAAAPPRSRHHASTAAAVCSGGRAADAASSRENSPQR